MEFEVNTHWAISPDIRCPQTPLGSELHSLAQRRFLFSIFDNFPFLHQRIDNAAIVYADCTCACSRYGGQGTFSTFADFR